MTTKKPASIVEGDERRAERFETALPVEVDGNKGWLRDISATGVYFDCASTQEPGTPISFTIEVTIRGEKLQLVCEGEVVRVDSRDGRHGVAAKLKSSFFSGEPEQVDSRTLLMPSP